MKNRITQSIVLAAILAGISLLSPAVQAQTTSSNQIPNLITNQFTPFITQVYEWGTSYNTNLVWTNEVSVGTGMATTTGQKVADRIKAAYNAGAFHVGAEGDFIGAGSPITKVEADAGYAFVNKYDFQFGPELGAGYDFNVTDSKGQAGAIVIDPKLQARKKITQSTFAEITYGQPFRSVGKFEKMGEVYVGAGFTF